ncbi:TetR/AcrR family transcriptional regulator [Streptomyces sp. NPDC004237]|uniref:TetR/AcrR family transcriptional regulator n=1 Tax=Streptomyces sp. NPDC004237 TaxID=3154455 RepID=UPI0033AD5F57
MAITDEASPRDRLLDAASDLFSRDDVSIGVEALCRSAGVSKRSAGLERRALVRGPAQVPGYCGCPYLAVLVELKDGEHPASVVDRAAKDLLRGYFEEQAGQGGAADPALLARRLMLAFDGAGARAGAGIEHLDDGLLTATATMVLNAAGMK